MGSDFCLPGLIITFPCAHYPLATWPLLQLCKASLSLQPLGTLFPFPGMQTCGLSSHFIQASSQMSPPPKWPHWPAKRAPTSIIFIPLSCSLSSWYLLPKSMLQIHLLTYFLSVLVLVHYCCCNKLLRTGWLKQHKLIILQLRRPHVWIGPHWTDEGISRAVFLLEALGEKSCPHLFHSVEATCSPWHTSPLHLPSQ